MRQLKKDFVDGICENCSYTGIAGEICPECHTPLVKIDPELSRSDAVAPSDKPETYPLDILDKEEQGEKDFPAINEE